MALLPRALLAPSLLAVIVAAAPAARAADCDAAVSTCIDSDVLWPTPGPTTFFSIGSATPTAKGRFGLGFANALQSSPIVLRKSAAGPAGPIELDAVGTQLNTTFLFSYGVTDRLQVDAATPVTFYQQGSGVSTKDGFAEDLPSNTVRDVRIGAAYALLGLPRTGKVRGAGIAARFDLSIPTGEREVFASNGSLVAVPSLLFENRIGPVVFGAQVGARLRSTRSFFDQKVGSQGYVALGVAGSLDKAETLALTGEAFALPTFVDPGPSPVQWLAGVRWSGLLSGDLVVHGGAGAGFRGDRAHLLEPSWRAVLDLRYAPLGRDRDGDGVEDRDDKCPDVPEDRDGFEDEDGCPELDNDKDGIPDKSDRCPDEPEDKDGFQDDDGCPEPDTDGDGIKDAVDKCPDQAEDLNGYQDDDGCPEGGAPVVTKKCADGSTPKPGQTCDVDHDGIEDELDACPLAAEDMDGIADEDGCPEKDADEDGVGDQVDKCPLEPETIDGKDDDDGCPEPGAASQVTFAAGAIELVKPLRFAAGSAKIDKAMTAQVAMIAQRMQGLVDRGVEKIVIEAWADTAGETKANEALAIKRAEAVAKALADAGIPAGLIQSRPGDLADPPKKPAANWLVTVRTKRKQPLSSTAPAKQP